MDLEERIREIESSIEELQSRLESQDQFDLAQGELLKGNPEPVKTRSRGALWSIFRGLAFPASGPA